MFTRYERNRPCHASRLDEANFRSSPDYLTSLGLGFRVTPAGTPGPSCAGLAPTCGPAGNESCCTSLLVPGGTFYRTYGGVTFNDKSFPATVSDFALDKCEITVGRFRAFVNAGMVSTLAGSAGEYGSANGTGRPRGLATPAAWRWTGRATSTPRMSSTSSSI